MSRNFSPAALKAFFSPDCDEHVICLLTLYVANLGAPIRIADGYTQRLSATDDDVVYGVVSRGEQYVFLPYEIGFPSEEEDAGPRANVTIHNATRYITPQVRSLTAQPTARLEIILASAPDTLEASFDGLSFVGIHYDRDVVTGYLTIDTLALEPFPCDTFTPAAFPGLF